MKRLADQTLYEILEVPPDAAPDAIVAAYDRVRSLYGPGSLVTYSLMSAEEAAVLTSRIEDAKRTLLDADARARYDASLADAAVRPEPSNGTNGTSHPPFSAVPIIPALAPSPPDPSSMTEDGRGEGRELPIPLSADEPSPHAPAPIRLERKVETARPEPAAPVLTPAPAAVTPAPAAVTPAPSPAPPAAAVAPASRPAQEAAVPMPEGALWSGEALRKVREARGITVPQISERTKVTRHHIENIEGERFSALPAAVYLRGILFALARELRLDGQKVARAYLERVAAAAAQATKPR